MRESIVIDKMISFARTHPDVSGLALLGSHARGDAGPLADIDLVLLVPEKEVITDVLDAGISFMSPGIKHVIKPESNKRVALTANNCLKIDMTAVGDASDIEVAYRSSRISNPENAVLVDNEGILMQVFEAWSNDEKDSDLSIHVSNEVEKFIESFEAASRYARQNDVFRFYFNFNLSLTRYGRLVQLEQDDDAFLYTPRRLLENMGTNQRRATERLCAPLEISKARPVLIALKAEFLSEYFKLKSKYSVLTRSTEEVSSMLQDILNRDMVWNLRDVAWVMPDTFNEGRLFRASTLSRFEGQREYDVLLERLGINRIIDLRCAYERARYPYSDYTTSHVEVVHLAMDPKNDTGKVLGPTTGILHADLLDNSKVVREFFSLLADGIPTLVHCHNGKDRTGVLIALASLAAGVPVELAYKDFLASGMDITNKDTDAFFGRIEELGGIDKVLTRLGVPEPDVVAVHRWLLE
ncbi:MAG: tyrosine-protein phosphatase [ANME-2 cluster archaeon]|nr:tyrosine-protein phosphatase [ANME-2 cluster archaeon]